MFLYVRVYPTSSRTDIYLNQCLSVCLHVHFCLCTFLRCCFRVWLPIILRICVCVAVPRCTNAPAGLQIWQAHCSPRSFTNYASFCISVVHLFSCTSLFDRINLCFYISMFVREYFCPSLCLTWFYWPHMNMYSSLYLYGEYSDFSTWSKDP